ncbi:integrator complex subunit 5 omd [Rhodnius prolixus]|uniref:integrator complex subunit 5 omd n=1 Tax=Rhodnius prolixus TaxID=13249 RepID=UPI003D187B2B
MATSVIKQLPPKDLLLELHTFIANVKKPSNGSPSELVRKALSLLKTLPASRDAVFEYLGTVFEKTTLNHMQELENRNKPQNNSCNSYDDSIIEEINASLNTFLTNQPLAWAVIVSKWAFEQLGSLSSKYSSRGKSPVNGSLSDSLQQWMSCTTTSALLDITMHCLKKLIGNDEARNCISFLLDTCVRHSPHFDWVVAYIGSCYPEMVVIRVLSCGLQEYSCNPGNATKIPKLKSVVGILIHLSGSHRTEIKKAMSDLFNWSMEENSRNEHRDIIREKNSAVPYLLQLASLAPVLLEILCSVIYHLVKPTIFNKLVKFGVEWAEYTGSRQALLDLIVHLILSVTSNSEQLFTLILDGTSHPNTSVSAAAEEILALLIKELELLVRGNSSKVPFLDCIQKNVDNIFYMLLSDQPLQTTTAVTILSFIGEQQPTMLPRCVSYVLLNSTDDEHLATIVRLAEGYKSSVVLSPAISLTLNATENVANIWTNLTKLVKWESSGTLVSLPILNAIYDNLLIMSKLLCKEKNIKVAHTIAELLKRPVLANGYQPNIQLCRSIVKATVSYFYMCLVKAEGIDEMKGLSAINAMLKKLCQSSGSTRSYALRELLESSLFRAPSVLFGSIPPLAQPLIEDPISLMMENMKQGHTTLMGQRHSSVFHSGVIGSGKRRAVPACPIPYNDVIHNKELLLSVLEACCTCETSQGTLDSVISIALLLVELISPDVMYNGLPWPEEDFCKVTVERDLYIRRVLDEIPLTWSLLAFIAHHRPALCYCSVILRAVIATLLGQWSSASQQGRGPGYNKDLIFTTTKILQIMALGQLLPPPFTALSDVVPHIPPHQVVLLLRDCVWNYMRDHVPSPALFGRDANGVMWRDTSTSRPPKQYTETLRHVMLDNLSSLGALYHTLFVKDLLEDE